MWLSVLPSFELRIVMGEDLESNTKAPPTQAPRSRLLLSCGESVLAVAERAYRRVETMTCPVGCLARGVSHVAAPVLRPLRLRCLSALSFFDRQLLVAQDVAAVLFPPTERVLSKVDGLVLFVESLPVWFDGAADGLEALVAGVRSGVAAKRACRDGKSAGDAFRDIRCNEEAGGAARRDVEKVCEGVTREAESLVEVVTVTVDDGGEAGDETKAIGVACAQNITGETRCNVEKISDMTRKAASPEVVTVTVHGGCGVDGGVGDETKNICVAHAETITGETRCNEEMQHSGTGDDHFRTSSVEIDHANDDAAQAAYTEAMHPEAEKQEAAGSEESEEKGEPMKFDMSGAEQHAEGVRVEQDGRSMEVVETHDAEIMEAVQSMEIEEVESQQVASPEAGTSETGEVSGKESNKDGDLLDLFDEAWQHKLA